MEKLYELKEFVLAKRYYVIGGVVFLLLIIGSIYFSYQKLNSNEEEEVVLLEDKIEEEIVEKEACYVSVDIKGEVNNPGLYKVMCGSRVQDIINEAGGLTKNGDTSILNLGKKVVDEMVIVVYSKKEVISFTETKNEEIVKIEGCTNNVEIKNDACINDSDLAGSIIIEDTNSEKENAVISDTPVKVLVSINKGTKEELMTLSGIGESKANSIISYRNEVGGFKSLEEIKNIKGIGDSIFEKIKNDITL